MAKIAFSKLNKIKTISPKTITVADAEVTVAQYLPLEEKLNLIQTVIELSGNGEEGFYNIVKLETYYMIEMIKAYTNVTITEKQQEDSAKLYDAIVMNDIWEKVKEAIPQKEQDYIWGTILSMAREVTDYNRSALGILKLLKNEYNEEGFTLDKITDMLNKINDPKELELIKSTMKELG